MALIQSWRGYFIAPFQTDTRKLCFMDMTVNGEPLGRIDLNLNYEITPKTAQNFRYKQYNYTRKGTFTAIGARMEQTKCNLSVK